MSSNLKRFFCFGFISFCVQPVFSENLSASKTHLFTASTTFATDYKFRGISQTMNDPAVHASFDYAHSSGFSAGVWGSNIDSAESGPADDEADLELDIYVGWGTNFNDDWAVNGTLIHYLFPGTASGFDLDWTEFQFDLHYQDYLSFQIAYSDEVFNLKDSGLYYGLSGNYPIADKYRLIASVGYSDLDDALGDSYVDFSIGAEADIGIFTAQLVYVGADNNGADLFGDNKADQRFVFSISTELSQ
ncbi:MAG: TorF family putative porin [Spongiibacteraceae bacterium]